MERVDDHHDHLHHSSSQDSIAFSSTPPPPIPSNQTPKKTTSLKLRIGLKSQEAFQSETSQLQQQTPLQTKRPITLSFTAPPSSLRTPQQPSKKIEDYTFPYTWEDQFIIRFPPSLVPLIVEALGPDGKGLSLCDLLKISFLPDATPNTTHLSHPTHSFLKRCPRRAKVTISSPTFPSTLERDALLLDLPCIIETHKTVDKSQYTKIADIHQMLLVFDENVDFNQHYTFYKGEDFRLSSGLTPPMKDVRQKRFLKTGMSIPPPNIIKRHEEIEDRVQAILDGDAMSEGSTFRLFDSRTGKIVLEGGNEDFLDNSTNNIGDDDIGDDGESDHQRPMEDDFALELEEDIGGGGGGGNRFDANSISAGPVDDDSISEVSSSITSSTINKIPIQEPHHIIELENNLLTKIEERKKQLSSITNPMIKARLEDVIGQLEMDLQRNKQQRQ